MQRQALCAVLLAFAALLPAVPAAAAPAELDVRIEGRSQTLFEGPVRSDGHYLQAASDPTVRRCDGTNAGAHPAPGPTPTAAAWDAMAIVGQGFDGRWYSGYDDYFVQQWGPDRESYDDYAFWGVLVDGSFINVGGCQYRAEAGDEVLWAYDAFNSRPFLRLAAATDPRAAPAPPSPVAYAELDQPLSLLVQRYSGAMDGGAQNVAPVAGVPVAPLKTDPATGFETAETGDGTPTLADGTVELTFDEPGWHPLKAADDADYVRSNRLEVCVRPAPGQDCGPLPADARLREYGGPFPQPPAGGDGGKGSSPSGGGSATEGPPGKAKATARLGLLRLAARRGTATLAVRVDGPGRLRLSGPGLRAATARPRAAGTVRLAVVPRARAREALRRRGRLAVVASIRFRGTGGLQALRRKLTLRWAPSR